MASAATLSLREWIKCALQCSKNSVSTNGGCNGRDALSWDYLLASLKIAVSLSDEMNNSEDLAVLLRQTWNGSMPDWAEFVTVRLKDEGGLGEEEREAHCAWSSSPIEPIPYSISTEPGFSCLSEIDGGDVQALLDYLNGERDDSLAVPTTPTRPDITDLPEQDKDERSYLNVHSAQIEATDKRSDACEEILFSDPVRDKEQLIYRLGLVFYELFSGGEMPPPELLVSPYCLVETHDDDDAKTTTSSRDLDFARGVQVYDDSKVDEDCDLFSDSDNCNDLLGCAERPTEDLGESSKGFRSRKRQSSVHRSLLYSEHSQGKRDKKAALSRVISLVSIEQLKLKGLPGSLTSMIYNMIDCINGDFSGDESYSNISHVTSDLHLMIEFPDKFLRDLDVNALAMTPLSLNETIFVRNDEFASLQRAYRRSASGSPEIALIAGESGTGKTWLANRVGRYIVSQGGVFLQGKFDSLHRTQPFSVVATAFNAYCDLLIQETDRERAKAVALRLQEALGRDACQLVKVIPTLSDVIVYEEHNNDADAIQNYMDAEKRLYYLMCRFVETISSCSDCIIALFLDDLQWADELSISIVGEILKSSDTNKRFFFLGSYRDDDIENGHPFLKMIENVQGLGVTARTVKLECMDKDMVTRMLSHLLCLSPRLLRSLSDIVYHKTKGNPLFFSQFMISLNRDGLLYRSLARRRWEWDEEKIMSKSLPDDVAVLFSQRIGKLPSDVKLALNALSCFGASIEVDVIKNLEANFGDKLIDPLALAEKEGFVYKLKAKYFFGHDCIQEAAYNLTAAEERCLHHMKYGLSLAEISLNTNDNNKMLFVAVGQINLGGPSAVSDDEQRLKIVKYNLAAGKMAMDMSEFHSAFNLFDNGITFLKKTHWSDHYDLSLELFELAAECALITGDMLSVSVLSDQVTKNAACFEDTLNTSYILMSTLSYASKISDAAEMGLEILSKLGEELPRSFSCSFIELQIKMRQAMLDEMLVIDLLNYKMMTDKKKMMAMKFLSRLYVIVQQVNPNLLPLIPLKMVEITIESGMSHLSPVGFAFFGSIVAKLGDIKGGHKFTSLAKSLIDKMKLRDIAGEVFCVATDILCFIEPFQIANENRKEIEAIALAAGDVTWSCYSRVMYVTGTFWSSSKLSVSSEVMTQGRRFVISRGHITTDNYLLLVQQSILKLTGGSVSEIIPDDDLKQRILDSNNHHALEIYYFQKTYASFMLDDYDSMKESAVELCKVSAKPWLLHSNHIFHVLIGGLVSFRIYRETKVSFWLEQGTKFKSQMQLWAEQGSSWTFENKCLLLEAEEHFSNNRLAFVQAAYDKAISSAKAHKLINEEAIAYELAAKFFFNISDFSTSLKYYTAAHEKYSEWGAYAKAERLLQCIEKKFMTCLGDPSAHPSFFPDGFERQSFDSEGDQRKRKQP